MSVALRLAPVLAVVAVAVTGCGGGGSQAPSAAVSGASGDCKAQKAEMAGLVNQGVEGEIAAAEAGKTLSSEAQARVDRYNGLLNSYLGGGCHTS